MGEKAGLARTFGRAIVGVLIVYVLLVRLFVPLAFAAPSNDVVDIANTHSQCISSPLTNDDPSPASPTHRHGACDECCLNSTRAIFACIQDATCAPAPDAKWIVGAARVKSRLPHAPSFEAWSPDRPQRAPPAF